MKTAILPLIVLLSGVAHAQFDTVTLTGETSNFFPAGSNFPQPGVPSFPFVISFTIDTDSGVQTFQYCGATICAFSAGPLIVTNVSAEIGGVPELMPTVWGAGGSGPATEVFAGIGGKGFEWGFDAGTQGVSPNLNSLLTVPRGFANDGSFLNGFALGPVNVSITSVPEPRTLGLLTLALTGLFVSRVLRTRGFPLRP
jgi:hypothetical protein